MFLDQTMRPAPSPWRRPWIPLLLLVLTLESLCICQASWALGLSSPTKRSSGSSRPTMSSTDAMALQVSRRAVASEPAGVVRMFSRPRSIRKSIRKRRKQAKILLQHGSRRLGRYRSATNRNTYLVDELVQKGALEDLSIPPWACDSSEELKQLASMKALLKSEFDSLASQTIRMESGHYATPVEAFPDVYGDFRLLRYLRKDKVQNAASAAQRYRNFLRWREEFHVDEIRRRVEEHPFSPPHHLSMVGDLFPSDFDLTEHDTDDAHPETLSVIMNVGVWDARGITSAIQRKELTVRDFLQYWTHIFESLHRKLYLESMETRRMLYVDVIADLYDMNMNQFNPSFLSSVIKPWITLTQSNYPQTSRRICFLRPPRILSALWNVVAPMASPTTVAKIQFYRDFKGSCYDFVRKSRSDAAPKKAAP